MGLGKTITCVSLIAATLDSAKAFASSPLEKPPPPQSQDHPNASHFAGSVWNMPSIEAGTSQKSKAQLAKLQEKLGAEYARASRIKAKSRATLIVCPLSTVSNWEDQFREHWRGEVKVVGGSGGNCVPVTPSQSLAQLTLDLPPMEGEQELKNHRPRENSALRVYIYHGNARRPDPHFLADFDAVITTFATLASEFSRQNKTATSLEEDEDAGSSDGAGAADVDGSNSQALKPAKSKKAGVKRKKSAILGITPQAETSSPLQSIHWFRVVLDEAQ
jgi:SWI/SNF-related matrix-associated actin-dependent regulator of chromatin subfamily A3